MRQGFQEILFFFNKRFNGRGIPLISGFGRPNEGLVLPRHDKYNSLIFRSLNIIDALGEMPFDKDMGALNEVDGYFFDARRDFIQDAVDPRAGGVDEHCGFTNKAFVVFFYSG